MNAYQARKLSHILGIVAKEITEPENFNPGFEVAQHFLFVTVEECLLINQIWHEDHDLGNLVRLPMMVREDD